MLAFFVPSVGLSRFGRARKKKLVDIGKGGARDAWQVFANGGVATLCAVLAGLSLIIVGRLGALPEEGGTYFVILHGLMFGPGGWALAFSPGAWMAAFAGSYAAATADTWGTEIGTLVRGTPHSILTRRPIPTGLSGGVTRTGTAAEIVGAAWIAAATAGALTLLNRWPEPRWTFAATQHFIAPVLVGGIAGALVDSVLGATLQELRRCPVCERTCETNPHVCGTPTLRIRGIRGFSNDLVNFIATLTGAGTAFALFTR